MSNSGKPSFAGIQECKPNRRRKFRRRSHSPWFEMLSITGASSESGLAVSLDAPGRPVFQGPIKQGTFKTDVVASFLALDPFVTKDLLAFG